MSIMYKATLNTLDPSNKDVAYVGNGTSEAAARAELNAKVHVAVLGTKKSFVESKIYTEGDVPTFASSSGGFDDAGFFGVRAGATVRIPVRNVALSFLKAPGTKSRALDPADGDVQAVVTTHTDGNGVGGFVFDHAGFDE